MHSWTSLAARSCAQTGGGLVQKPSSSETLFGHFSVCFTQQPSRCTIRVEVHAQSAGSAAATMPIRFMCPSPERAA